MKFVGEIIILIMLEQKCLCRYYAYIQGIVQSYHIGITRVAVSKGSFIWIITLWSWEGSEIPSLNPGFRRNSSY